MPISHYNLKYTWLVWPPLAGLSANKTIVGENKNVKMWEMQGLAPLTAILWATLFGVSVYRMPCALHGSKPHFFQATKNTCLCQNKTEKLAIWLMIVSLEDNNMTWYLQCALQYEWVPPTNYNISCCQQSKLPTNTNTPLKTLTISSLLKEQHQHTSKSPITWTSLMQSIFLIGRLSDRKSENGEWPLLVH